MTFLPLVTRCSVILGALGIASVHGAESASDATHRSGWRAAVLADVLERYQPDFESPPLPAATSIFKDPTHVPDDPDVVVLEPLIVLTEGDLKRVGDAIANYNVRKPVKARRWGTGLVERDFGRFRVGIASIFYVPVLFGVSW